MLQHNYISPGLELPAKGYMLSTALSSVYGRRPEASYTIYAYSCGACDLADKQCCGQSVGCDRLTNIQTIAAAALLLERARHVSAGVVACVGPHRRGLQEGRGQAGAGHGCGSQLWVLQLVRCCHGLQVCICSLFCCIGPLVCWFMLMKASASAPLAVLQTLDLKAQQQYHSMNSPEPCLSGHRPAEAGSCKLHKRVQSPMQSILQAAYPVGLTQPCSTSLAAAAAAAAAAASAVMALCESTCHKHAQQSLRCCCSS